MATSKDYADVLSLEKRVLCYKALYDLHQTSIKWLAGMKLEPVTLLKPNHSKCNINIKNTRISMYVCVFLFY